MDINQKLSELIQVSGYLADLLTEENKLLAQHKAREAGALADRKTKITRFYEQKVKELTGEPEALAQVDANLREQLRMAGERIDGLMVENSRRLKVALDVNRRVVDAIAKAARDITPGPKTYSAGGVVGKMNRASKARAAALSFDKSL